MLKLVLIAAGLTVVAVAASTFLGMLIVQFMLVD